MVMEGVAGIVLTGKKIPRLVPWYFFNVGARGFEPPTT